MRTMAMDAAKAKKYFELARFQADLFSKDPVCKVAAILLARNSLHILSTGFNGLCRKHAETPERWERPAKYKWVCHAELNAVANAARSGVSVEGSVCVVTLFPCADCCKALIQAGVSHVITREPDWHHVRWGDDFRIAMAMMEESGVEVTFVDDY